MLPNVVPGLLSVIVLPASSVRLPVLFTLAFSKILPVPNVTPVPFQPAVKVTAPEPLMPMPALTVILPLLFTVMLPPVLLMPVIASVAILLVRLISPVVALAALNTPTALAPVRVVPPKDDVTNVPAEIVPPAVSLSAPL